MPVVILETGYTKKCFLFVHIPKTGGTALLDYFKRIGALVYLGDQNNPIVGRLRCPSQHFEYAISDLIFDIDAFDFSFGIVRHPISRAKSDYLWAFRNSSDNCPPPSFDDWIEFAIRKYRSDPYFFENHVRPQNLFLGPKIRKIYRYEDGLEQVLRDTLTNLGLSVRNPERQTIMQRNTAKQHRGLKSSDVSISSRSYKLLLDFYSEDFEVYGYER